MGGDIEECITLDHPRYLQYMCHALVWGVQGQLRRSVMPPMPSRKGQSQSSPFLMEVTVWNLLPKRRAEDAVV